MIMPGALLPLATALALGLLIGLERGWHEREAQEGQRVAGVRTYGLLGLLGGLTGLLSRVTHPTLPGFGFVAVAAALIVGHWMTTRRDGDLGITSLVAGMLTYALGAAATLGYVTEAAAAAVVTTFLLGYKLQLHRWIGALEQHELRAGLKLLLISVVVLPLLPNRGFGPWQAVNPFEVWWMVVLIAGVSFAGYFAIKLMGPGKGVLLTGLFAGLASSTVLTLHFSRLSRRRPEMVNSLGPGILLACGTMFPRLLLIGSLINRQLFGALVIPALAMGAIVMGSAALSARLAGTARHETGSGPVGNPFELRAALVFAAFLVVVMLLAEGLKAAYGGSGVLALASISGITDVDPITLTLAKMSRADLRWDVAARGIVLAAAVNSVVKAGMVLVIGGRRLGLRTTLPLVLAAAVGLALVWAGVSV